MFSERVITRTTAGGLPKLLPPVRRDAFSGWMNRLLQSLGRRMQAAPRHLSVEERLMVEGRKSIVLVACHGRRFLLASSGDAITPLVEVLPISGPEPTAMASRLEISKEKKENEEIDQVHETNTAEARSL